MILRATTAVVGRLAARYPQDAKAKFFGVLFQPLIAYQRARKQPRGKGPAEDEELVPESEVSACLEDTHKLFVAASTASGGVAEGMVAWLQPVMDPLFRMYLLCTESRSYLRAGIQELLRTFFQTAQLDRAAAVFAHLVLGGTTVTPGGGHVQFAPGATGGVRLMIKTSPAYVGRAVALRWQAAGKRPWLLARRPPRPPRPPARRPFCPGCLACAAECGPRSCGSLPAAPSSRASPPVAAASMRYRPRLPCSTWAPSTARVCRPRCSSWC